MALLYQGVTNQSET